MNSRIRLRSLVLALVILTLVASCSSTAGPNLTTLAPPLEEPTPTTASTSTEQPTVEPRTRSTTTTTEPDESLDQSSAALAASFLAARAERDVELALTHLAPDVVSEWGPTRTYDTLALGWAWEDAFTMTHTTDSCETIEATADIATVVCLLKVDSKVATAAGNSPGLVCATIEFADQLITHLSVESGPECNYNYWPNMFAPFGEWLATAHPETTIGDMYNDRISKAGLDLWIRYTQEFLADHD